MGKFRARNATTPVPNSPRGMAERNFIVLKYQGEIPAMAGCEKCERKFFTPATYSHDAVGAYEYLLSKFDRHNCEKKVRAKQKPQTRSWS